MVPVSPLSELHNFLLGYLPLVLLFGGISVILGGAVIFFLDGRIGHHKSNIGMTDQSH
jgi:hypothetical protein